MLDASIAAHAVAINHPEIASLLYIWGQDAVVPNTDSSERPTMRGIADDVCYRRRVSLAALRGPRRFRPLVRARQEFMFLARAAERWSYPQIGRWLGGRDHTTIIHGMRAHAKRVGTS